MESSRTPPLGLASLTPPFRLRLASLTTLALSAVLQLSLGGSVCVCPRRVGYLDESTTKTRAYTLRDDLRDHLKAVFCMLRVSSIKIGTPRDL